MKAVVIVTALYTATYGPISATGSSEEHARRKLTLMLDWVKLNWSMEKGNEH